MDKFEKLILRWLCLFDDFKENEYSSIKNLVTNNSFKEFVDNVFCFKCSMPEIQGDEKLYNTIKVNYQEFEIQKYEDLYNEENSIYTCVIVLLHALLKCTNNKFRDQLSERMDNKEQILLAKFLEATQSTLFTKNNISEALTFTVGKRLSNSNDSEIFSNDVTPIKSKSMQRSYLQEFCESPKSQSLIYQEKEKLIAKLTEDYKNECEENYKMAENLKILQDLNIKLGNKLEDKDKIIQFLKDEIEEFSKPKEESIDNLKIDNYSLLIKKLNQDIIDLDINNKDLKNQIAELENKHKDLNGKFEKTTSDYENLLFTFDNIEAENVALKENMDVFKKALEEKDIEIVSLKDELCNKSISNNPLNSSCKEANVPISTLFDELNCFKLEEVTHDKEKYRHKYKSVRKDLLNAENHVKDLDEQIITLKQQLHNCESHAEKLMNKFSDKKKELQECQKKNNCLENKIKHLKDSIKAKEHDIESLCTKLDKKENYIKKLLEEMDNVKKAKTMIELILSKTNTEIEVLHEENNKYVNNLLATIEDYKHSEELTHNNIIDLENNIKKIQENLADKENIIIFYEEKMAENYQTISYQEEQLKIIYQEKLVLESCVKDLKTEIEAQQKTFSCKNREMENCLEYHLDELKDVKNTVLKVEEILQCKQNKIDQQNELMNLQKNTIITLKSEKCSQEDIVSNLNGILEEKSTEIIVLKEKVQEFISNVNKLTEQFNTTLNEKTLLEKKLQINEVQMKKSHDEFQCQICDMQNVLESRSNEICQLTMDFDKLKDTLEKKQNDFNDQLVISNNQIETISHLSLENCELKENLKSNNQYLLDKENEIVSLKDTIIQSGLKISNLTEQINLEISKNHLLTKNLQIITSTMKNMQSAFNKQLLNFKTNLQFYDNKIDAQIEKLSKLKNHLLVKRKELDTQINLNSNQKQYILTLETENVNLLEKLKFLDQCLLEKYTEIVSLEENLQNNSSTISNLEEKLGVMSIEKIMIETNLNETTEQLKNSQDKFTEQINNLVIQLNNCEEEIIQLKNQSLKMVNMLENKQKEFDDQLKLTFAQYEIVNNLKCEKELLEEQILNANKHSITVQNEMKSLTETLDEFKSSISHLEKELDSTKMEKISIETKLKDTIYEKDVINQELSEKLKNVNNCLKDSTNKNNDLKNCLSELKNDLNLKITQFDFIIEENNKLKETVDCTENQCINLQDTLNKLNDCILKKEEDINLLKIQNLEYSTTNDNLKIQINEIKHVLNNKHIEFENQVKSCNEQREIIVKFNCEKESLCDQIKCLEDTLSHKEYEFNLCEGKLYDCSNTINSLEQKLAEMKTEKSSLELQMNETITQLTDKNQDLTLQLEINENNVLQIQEKLIQIQNDFKEQKKQVDEQRKTISLLNAENDRLLNETNKLQEYSNEKECTLKSLHEKILDYKKQFDKSETLKINLESELDKNKLQLNDLHQKSKQQIEDMESKYIEIQEQFDKKEVEINEYVGKYNCQLETIALLTSERDNLISEIGTLKNTLLNMDGVIASNKEKLLEYEENNNNMKAEKAALEIEFEKTIKQLETTCQVLTQQLEDMESKYTEIQEQSDKKQVEINEYNGKYSYQLETIALLTSERDNLISETGTLKNMLLNKDGIIASNKEKLLEYEENNNNMKAEKVALEIEFKKTLKQLETTCQELTQQLEDMKSKYTEMQEQFDKKEVEINEYIGKYNSQMESIARLTLERDNLISETGTLKNTLLNMDGVIASNKEKLLEYEENNNNMKTEKAALEIEFEKTIKQLETTCQVLTQQLEDMEKKLCDLQENLSSKHIDLETQVEETNKQIEVVSMLTSEKDNLINEIDALKNRLLEKDTTLELNYKKLINFETQSEELIAQKNCLESELNETKVQLDNVQHDLTEQCENATNKLQEVQEQLIMMQKDLEEQNKCYKEQTEAINALTLENNNLLEETNMYKESLALNQNKLQDSDKQNKEIELQNASLMVNKLELNQLKVLLNNIRQEFIEQIVEMDKKLCEDQEQISNKQCEIKNQIKLKNDSSLADIYQKINDLKNIKNELKLVLKKERTDFETSLESYSNSLNRHTPIQDHHENSLMEVITSADTFIEQNGIQLAQVENYEEYSIIERLKKLFEALKMFIININTQGNGRAITNIKNEYASNEAYDELLTKSNTQQETIKHLENEISKLKAECNYKMTKIQQKTQEFVTSEYEKKFERKREQMKQFCKDLETKIHQDYETKLMKYKEKIKKDEMHIKELGQQLWEVSEKYLKLQQKERRESTMSLPFEMSTISQPTTNVPRYNSFTLPKSSSASQIRSLVEETTRSNQDISKRNVPSGIGKKFSLSSGKIFPKEEDEEGEMFNHSCLADLKQGRVRLNDNNGKQYNERLSELQARNSLCPPHLRSCYAVETNYLPIASLITEEDIKTLANYSDCESENLIPNDRNKKKDRNQTSYKKPGPPTPSKNGGRASLSGNTKALLKEPKESNVNKRRASSTPNKLFSLFMGKK